MNSSKILYYIGPNYNNRNCYKHQVHQSYLGSASGTQCLKDWEPLV